MVLEVRIVVTSVEKYKNWKRVQEGIVRGTRKYISWAGCQVQRYMAALWKFTKLYTYDLCTFLYVYFNL